jgi:hypothetical protein
MRTNKISDKGAIKLAEVISTNNTLSTLGNIIIQFWIIMISGKRDFLNLRQHLEITRLCMSLVPEL